jgi:hypothetical protein
MGATPAPQRGELVAEHDRGELAGGQRLGVGAIDAAQSGLDVERRQVATGQLAQDAAVRATPDPLIDCETSSGTHDNCRDSGGSGELRAQR